ncbi:MAG: histidine kinase [Candidatus Eisenbacteria bacterium]|nr:histidine kinase [Candidatus Eisenbacteria bacterium]
MHPLLASRVRQALYLAAWAGIGALLAVMLGTVRPRPTPEMVAFLAPLTLFYAFACLSAWWVCRANPLATTPPERLLAVVAVASGLASAVWVALGAAWAAALARITQRPIESAWLVRDATALGAAGVVLYAQSMAFHYFLLIVETARMAERRLLETQVTAREAELRALRSQLHPHFLFNSLNSISALAGGQPEAARRMCQLLGEFLRVSLGLGARPRVSLAEELALAELYLGIEQVRFGERLAVGKQVSPEACACAVPPLLIQPLVENAVKHGVADRVEGGTVRIEACVRGASLEIEVANPRDPEAPPRRGQGMGLENVRRRLEALDPAATRVEVFREPDSFRVRLRLPAVAYEAGGPGGC